MSKLIVKHNAGFFSCCSVKLHHIIKYFNQNKKLPHIVDSSGLFNLYKINNNNNNDITFDYFDDYNNYDNIVYTKKIIYDHEYQYSNYNKLDYNNLSHFIKKYFSPSQQITDLIRDLEIKYNIDYNNICILFYRGNDKSRETKICGYNDYIIYAKKIINKNPNIKFLIQSDETEFIETIQKTFTENSFYMKEEIRHMKKCNNTVDKLIKDKIDKFSKLYLAITIIMSKCKYIICGSGNCSIWIMFYRGNCDNVYQNLNGKWYEYV